MHVIFRVDASVEMGTGHVMRSLTLAEELKRKGALVRFICREQPGDMCDFLEQKNFHVHRLPPVGNRLKYRINGHHQYGHWLEVAWDEDAEQTIHEIRSSEIPVDWVIVDHYGIKREWEEIIRRNMTSKILIIDDLADRDHDCDVLLDQNFYHNMSTRYEGLVPGHCKKLLGPAYSLLREEFVKERGNAKHRNGIVKKVLVFFGGSDPTNETSKALEAISLLQRKDIIIDVVVGNSNPNKEQVAYICRENENFQYHCQINYMGKLMAEADLAIGAGGSSTWERCFLGLPAITITTAENQVEMTRAVARMGAIQYVGNYHEVSVDCIRDAVLGCLNSPEKVKEMSNASVEIMGNLKAVGTSRVAQIILEGKDDIAN